MVRRALGAFTCGVVAGTLGFTVIAAAAPIDPRDPLAVATSAAREHAYEGTLSVTWRADGVLRSRSVTVHSEAGSLAVTGDRRLSAVGARRALRSGGVWHLLWNRGEGDDAPPIADKYSVSVEPGVLVAGRTTDRVRITDPRGRVREYIDLDRETGLLLRREQRNEQGAVMRITGFEEVAIAATPTDGAPAEVGPRVPRGSGPAPIVIAAPFRSVTRLPGGFLRVGSYRAAGGGREQYYSDGLVGVSVFEWSGSLKPGSLPAGGAYGTAGRADARLYESPVGQVAVWDAGGRTFAVVSEATPTETARIIAALPSEGVVDGPTRIGRFLIGPFTWR
ncbi:MAG: hypothetical protein RL531_1286 [Actinomycetota bacterium]